jgi:hypothetical protein
VVLVVAHNNFPEPFTDLGRAIMHPASKLRFESLQLRHHPLFRRYPPYDELPVAAALPTVVGEAQEREGCWLSLSPLFPVSGRKAPELDQSCLVRM